MEPILKVKNLTKNFGGLAAVSGINMEIQEGELIGLIGPNGAGKTTFFNLLTGVYEPSEGLVEMTVDGETRQIGGIHPYQITSFGVARTFQNIRLFKDMSVLENVMVGMHKNVSYKLYDSLLRTPAYYNEERTIREKACEYLKDVGLYHKRNEKADNLPYGEQRRLEIARALAIAPRILYLDEPAAGMNPQETNDLVNLIQKLRKKYKLTVILIEHDMSLVMTLCERIYVLNYGKLIADGTPEEIKNNEFVITAYLGEDI